MSTSKEIMELELAKAQDASKPAHKHKTECGEHKHIVVAVEPKHAQEEHKHRQKHETTKAEHKHKQMTPTFHAYLSQAVAPVAQLSGSVSKIDDEEYSKRIAPGSNIQHKL